MRSLFRQGLPRVAFVTYFLGAVVPLAALSFLAGGLGARLLRRVEISWPACVVAVAFLSMASFLALRRIVRQTRERMLEDQRRLLALVNIPATLQDVSDVPQAAGAAARQAVDLVKARAALVLWRDAPGDPLRVVTLAGDVDVLEDPTALARVRPPAEAAANLQRIAFRAPGMETEAGAWVGPSAVFLPLGREGSASGCLAVLHGSAREAFLATELDALRLLAAHASAVLCAAHSREAPEPSAA